MKRKAETGIIFLLPFLILGMLVFNARIMSDHSKVLNGFDQATKIYGEQFTVAQQTLKGKPGQTLSVSVTVRNTSSFIWPTGGANPVHMSYHVLDGNKKMVVNDGLRADLPNDLRPSQEITMQLMVKAP